MTQERAEQLMYVYGGLEEEVGVINQIVKQAVNHGMPYRAEIEKDGFHSNEDYLVGALKTWIAMKGVEDVVYVSHTPGYPVSMGGDICLSIIPYADLKILWQRKENEKAKAREEAEKTKETEDTEEAPKEEPTEETPKAEVKKTKSNKQGERK